MRGIFLRIASVVTATIFLSATNCLAAAQPEQAQKKMGVMERIKKSYSDLRSRGEKKEAIAPKEAVKPKETAMPVEAQPKPQAVKAEITKEEMLSGIKHDLDTIDEILENMPALRAGKDKDGKIFYTYNGVELDEMNKEELQKLFTMVRQMATRFKTERIERQLETARQAQRLAEQAPPKKIAVSGPPQAPRVPAPPPSASKPTSLPVVTAKPPAAPPTTPAPVSTPPAPPPSPPPSTRK